MTVYELALEYEEQYKALRNRIKGLRPLLCVYQGEDLLKLRRRIKAYYDMAAECRRTSDMLQRYYKEDGDEELH